MKMEEEAFDAVADFFVKAMAHMRNAVHVIEFHEMYPDARPGEADAYAGALVNCWIVEEQVFDRKKLKAMMVEFLERQLSILRAE